MFLRMILFKMARKFLLLFDFWKVETKFIKNLWKGMDLNWDHLYYFCVAYDELKSR